MPWVAPRALTPYGWLWLLPECSLGIRCSPLRSVFLPPPAQSCAPGRGLCLPTSIRARSISILHSARRDKLRALLPVHLYGQCADMDSLQKLGDEFRLWLIEDAAQAIGAHLADEPNRVRRAGSMGVSAAFSFYPTKNLSAYGEAGAVTTNSPEMAAHMRRLRNHGGARRYIHEEVGWNSRLDALQAAILRVKLKYVEGWNEARRLCAARYDELFDSAGLALRGESPENTAPIQLPVTSANSHPVFHQYVVRAYRRDELREFLSA